MSTAVLTRCIEKQSYKEVVNSEYVLKAAVNAINKQYGSGAIMFLGDQEKMAVDVIPSGSIAVDIATGVYGIPRGRIIEIYGAESSGKTTLALHIIAEAQKMGGIAAVIDAEHALDPEYAGKIGIDIEKLLVAQPDTGEQALDIVETLVRSGALDVIVVDSVAALVPKAEIDGEMGDSYVGLQARMMSQAMRKLTGFASKSDTAIIFINQIREKVGVLFGNPETTSGGRALKFYASMRIEIRHSEIIKRGVDIVGRKSKVKIVKNKVAPPFRQADIDIMFGTGISKEAGIVDLACELGIIRRSGAWYSYDETRLAQGRDNTVEYLKAHPNVSKSIEDMIRATSAGGTILSIKSTNDEEDDL